MSDSHFTLDKGSDGVAIVRWDSPSRSMNIIDQSCLEELESLVATIESDESIKSVILLSSKSAFGGGADLSMIESMMSVYSADIEKLTSEVSRLSLCFRRIELMEKSWICLLNGMAMGGCLELALACHVRLSVDDESIKFALPEVKVGLLPGGGGTQRMIRLIDPQEALKLLLQGRNIPAPKALKLGFIDELVSTPDDLLPRAKELIKSGCRRRARWDEQGFKFPFRLWTPMGMQLMSAANALLRKETYGNYPAAINILKCIYEGVQLPFDLALQVEVRYFVNCLLTPESKSMIRTFFHTMQSLSKGGSRPDVPKKELKTIGVIGAGFMGTGIAHVSAKAGLDVILLDTDISMAQKAKGGISEEESVLSLITPASDYSSLSSCDLVIEAVFEDKSVKSDVLSRAISSMSSGSILASNTSTIPITDLSSFSSRPIDFVGLHFFSPVSKMKLVEVIRGDQTGEDAIALAIDYVLRISKVPIIVNDCRGFYVNRCVIRYLNEAWSMLVEGIPVPMIDNIARSLGMPVGPLQLNDEVALDLSQKIMRQTISDLGESSVESHHLSLIDWLVSEGRLGKKSGGGFYDYSGDTRRLWSGLSERYPQQLSSDVSVEDLRDRYLHTISLEAVRVIEEDVCDVRSVDLGSILGFGFAPWTGGPLSYIDRVGADIFVSRSRELSEKYGVHFVPPKLLMDMAKTGSKFYD